MQIYFSPTIHRPILIKDSARFWAIINALWYEVTINLMRYDSKDPHEWQKNQLKTEIFITYAYWIESEMTSGIIARNHGHFELANNYQRYIVLHSGTIGTIEYQENSIWRRSRLDLQRSVFRTMTYTIWAPQIFYLVKRKRKEDLLVNLWDFSRQSDDLMSEFWFAFIKFSRQDYWNCI